MVLQMLRLGFRHKLIDGDALAVLQYRPDRLGRGQGRYATTEDAHQVRSDRVGNSNTERGIRRLCFLTV